MEAKDYYSLREIVLGLRDEYLKHNEKMDRLKELCVVDEKRVKDFNFSTLHTFHGRRDGSLPELSCRYEERLNQVLLLLRKIYSRALNYPDMRFKNGRVISENGSYHIVSCYDDFPLSISEENSEKFFEQANSILYSDFANEIDMHTWYNAYLADMEGIPLPKNIPGEFQQASINAFSTWFKVTMHMNDSNLKTFWLLYSPRTDSLELSAFGKDGRYKINEETINDILSIEYPTSRLNQYYIDTIDKSNKTDKDIIINCPETKKKIKLDIEETEKQMVLCKSRKN